jgi:hypothetical protein
LKSAKKESHFTITFTTDDEFKPLSTTFDHQIRFEGSIPFTRSIDNQ